MKGLEIAEDFFLNWGKPFLEQEFPQLAKRIAAGRFMGSDVIGADDEISQDHNWGPQFSLFLSEDDFSRSGAQLLARMNAGAPPTWKNYRVAGAGDKHVMVESVPRWIHQNIGFSEPPHQDKDWGVIVRDRRYGGCIEARESALYFLRHGALWLDNNEEFSHWRRILRYYPENVWYGRLAEECFRLWQYGEYNFVQRIARRGDLIAVPMCLGVFTESVMRIMLLLNKDYTPYWKWLAHEFRKLECAEHYAPLLERLLASSDTKEQVELVKQICHDIHERIFSLGIVTGKGTSPVAKYLLPLLNDHDEFTAKAAWISTTFPSIDPISEHSTLSRRESAE